MPKPMSFRPLPVYIGVDPGINGGIAVINHDKILVFYMPETEYDLLRLFRDIRAIRKEGELVPVANIEEVNRGFPGTSKATMALLYGSYCGLRMAMAASSISFEKVTSLEWQKGLKIRPKRKSENYNQRKDYLRSRAQELYPTLPIWDGDLKSQRAVCDALLIATYCQRKQEGKL